jgi:sigma-B regulation protein RsbU (phosphoserine phosphatase)
LHTYPDRHTTPGETLTAAGRLFHGLTTAGQFMTGLYLVLGPGGRVCWASAGQDPPMRLCRGGRVAPVDLAPVGLPLGIDPDEAYATVCWELEPGERLVLFTDGLVEAAGAGGELYGRARLRAAAGALCHLPLAEMVAALLGGVAAHRGGVAFDDDFTVLAVERS